MNEKKKSPRVFYYLTINGTDQVDFSVIPEFKDMVDYLNLNLFTCCFKNKDELVVGLKKLHLINPDTDVYSITITKRSGNKKDGYRFDYITNTIMYERSLKYLSAGRLKDILYANKDNYEFIDKLVGEYLDGLKPKAYSKEKDIRLFESAVPLSGDKKEKRELLDDIQKKTNSWKKFNGEITNLEMIRKRSFELSEHKADNEFKAITDLVNRLNEFVDSEIYYTRQDKTTPNNRGLVKLAKFISRYEKEYNLKPVDATHKYDEILAKYKKLLKLDYSSVVPRVLTSHSSFNEDDEEFDPDEYMLLEEDDFRGLLRSAASKEKIESIEVDIENLEERQMGRRRH